MQLPYVFYILGELNNYFEIKMKVSIARYKTLSLNLKIESNCILDKKLFKTQALRGIIENPDILKVRFWMVKNKMTPKYYLASTVLFINIFSIYI